MKHLKTLLMAGNLISDNVLSDKRFKCDSVSVLDLQKNHLKNIPDQFKKMMNLIYLDLSKNL